MVRVRFEPTQYFGRLGESTFATNDSRVIAALKEHPRFGDVFFLAEGSEDEEEREEPEAEENKRADKSKGPKTPVVPLAPPAPVKPAIPSSGGTTGQLGTQTNGAPATTAPVIPPAPVDPIVSGELDGMQHSAFAGNKASDETLGQASAGNSATSGSGTPAIPPVAPVPETMPDPLEELYALLSDRDKMEEVKGVTSKNTAVAWLQANKGASFTSTASVADMKREAAAKYNVIFVNWK